MRYGDTIEKSAEYLRLALPLMSKQRAGLHPVSYAVWYEYVSGRNAPLREAVDALLQDGGVLDEDSTDGLFRRYVADMDEESAKRVSAGFRRILADISDSAAEAGGQASRFGDALALWSEGLGTTSGEHDVDVILRDARQMQGAIGALQQSLEESRREVERLQQEVVRAREDAMADGLTGLTNRKGFDRALDACLAAAGGAGPSLLLADIDHFKRINDSFGHMFGDKVLRAVAQILRANVKGGDTAARYGGEEFVVLLPDTPLEGAVVLAERIRQAVAACRVRRLDNNEVLESVTVSLGVATLRAGESAGGLLARADAALYAAKNRGRNRAEVAGGE